MIYFYKFTPLSAFEWAKTGSFNNYSTATDHIVNKESDKDEGRIVINRAYK